MDEQLKVKLTDLEVKLHQCHIQLDVSELDVLLADDFFEIGTSGKSYSKKDILARSPSEDPVEIKTFDFEVREIQKSVVQIIYKTSTKEQRSFRNSIWVNTNAGWRIVFHQGTKLG